MRVLNCLALVFTLLSASESSAAEKCPFINDQQLASAMPTHKWSLISNQDGRGCIYQNQRSDTLMLSVFRNPTTDRAKELYAQFVKTLAERMSIAPVPGVGEETQAGATAPSAKQQEASAVTLTGDYIVSISLYRSGRPVEAALVQPLTEIARRAIGNVSTTSERFGSCEWLTADDAEGFLDRSTLTVQRTGANSCMMFDSAANTMLVAVIQMSRDTQASMMNRQGGCKHVALPELGRDAFGEHSCTGGNTNRASIYLWKNGKQAEIVFAPTKPHPESGSVEHLKAVAGRVMSKM
jgi:hypothetical protein